MTDTLDSIVEAMTRYRVGHPFNGGRAYVHDGSKDTFEKLREFDSVRTASDACKRMNARAVLEVLMERDADMEEAGGAAHQAQENDRKSGVIRTRADCCAEILRAMLTEILKE